MSIAYIALGSNLGDKEANLRQALKMLLVKGLQIRSVSSFFKTEPYLACPKKRMFIRGSSPAVSSSV